MAVSIAHGLFVDPTPIACIRSMVIRERPRVCVQERVSEKERERHLGGLVGADAVPERHELAFHVVARLFQVVGVRLQASRFRGQAP